MQINKYVGALILFLGLSAPAVAWDKAEMNKHIDATNVLVNDGCSGTFLKNGKVLTAAHCILSQYKTVEKEIVKDDGTIKKEKFQIALPGTISQQVYTGTTISQIHQYVYKIEKTDRTNDLALLKVDAKAPGGAELSCSDVIRGDDVIAVGNSFGVLYSTVTNGIVSSVNRSYRDLGIVGDLGDTTMSGENGLVQHSAVIAGGNSGGALYNTSGKIVGVNVRGGRSGFSFAVPLSDIRSFLEEKCE